MKTITLQQSEIRMILCSVKQKRAELTYQPNLYNNKELQEVYKQNFDHFANTLDNIINKLKES